MALTKLQVKNGPGIDTHQPDGEIGTVGQLYFDDEAWVIRYLTVETGGWLDGRWVLILPISVVHADWMGPRTVSVGFADSGG